MFEQNWGKKVDDTPLKTAFDHWSQAPFRESGALYL
jgi:hypothetical protein